VTRNGVTDSDGAFVGFGGNSTFGGKSGTFLGVLLKQ